MKYIPWVFAIIIIAGTGAAIAIASQGSVDVLSPIGYIGEQQKNLLAFAVGLSLLVVIPVFAMAIYIAKRYHYKNKSAYYAPDWDTNRTAESIWWGVPLILITILSIVTWQTTFALDPYKPLDNETKPLEVQVVALEWKWLFIYPEYDIASVNELRIPKDVPINFKITSDAPMNSFWIPSLGGQIYAMKGMQTKLHLISEEEGVVIGKSANISGEGFARMHFNTITQNQGEFDSWVNDVKKDGFTLGIYRYDKLAEPSIETDPIYYSKVEPNLFNLIIDKYMMHGGH